MSENGSNAARPMRLATLYMALADGDTWTAASLAETTGAGKRTVYRDIQQLRAAGLEIEGSSHVGYSVNAMPQLPPLFLTRAERTALAAVAPAGLKAKLRGL
jgi:predicted DNA-binding transcriptional regulator YafY